MSPLPQVGMRHEDVRSRVKRLWKAPNIPLALSQTKSLLNQTRLCNGQASVDAIVNELESNESQKSSRKSLSGSGSTQFGIGNGKKWTEQDYIDNGYIRKSPSRWTKVLD